MIELELEASIEAIASPSMPAGFSLRSYQPSDDHLWLAIHSATGVYDPVAPDLFETEFGGQRDARAGRQIYVTEPGGCAVGTATGWFPGPARDSRVGRVHWVAVIPEYQRRGRAGWLTGEVVRRLGQLGYARAYLSTSALNRPAICLYLSLGFRPCVRSTQESDVWAKIRAELPEALTEAARPVSA